MMNRVSLAEVDTEWQGHRLGTNRSVGGRRALTGFSYQLAVSLNQFLDMAEAHESHSSMTFDSLSDLAQFDGDFLFVRQIKSTLTRSSAIAAAKEALAVDEFLEEKLPELRDRVLYQVHGSQAIGGFDPRTLDGKALGDTADVHRRWDAVRTRTLEPVVQSDPFIRLVARLFKSYEDPFELTHALIGELLTGLGQNEPSPAIEARLFNLLATARKPREIHPPGRILNAEDFVSGAADKRILLGQRPTLAHLAGGFFMDRDDRVEDIVTTIDKVMEDEGEGLRVHWVTGASGAGKSVLLLQILERLVREAEYPVHLIEPLPMALRDALDYWSGGTGPIVIAIDDLYAPAHRDSEIWESLVALAFDKTLVNRILVLTAGPHEYHEDFTKMTMREEAFRVSQSRVDTLSDSEKNAYQHWYRQHTGTETGNVSDNVFVVAAFRAEIERAGTGNITQFAHRFLDRAAASNGEVAVLATLALNQLGFAAPATIFDESRETLDRLVSEDVAEIVTQDGTKLVTLYHQRLARTLYAALVPEDRLEDRAKHLATGFAAMLSNPKHANAFLDGMGSQRHRVKGPVRTRLLAYLWDQIWEAFPAGDHIELLVPWVFETLTSDLEIFQPPYAEKLAGWIFDEHTPSTGTIAIWPVLYRHCPDLRSRLEDEAVAWLFEQTADPHWAELYKRVLGLTGGTSNLLDLGEQWLDSNPHHEDWVTVFSTVVRKRKHCRKLAVSALELAPVGHNDRTLWKAALEHSQNPGLVVGWVTRRACRAMTRRAANAAVSFVVENGEHHAKSVRWGLERERDASRWSLTLRTLLGKARPRSAISLAAMQAGRSWLENNMESEEWPRNWHPIFRASLYSKTKNHLAELAYRWLDDHKFQQYWLGIVRQLRVDNPVRGLAYMKLWLREQGDHPVWPTILRELLKDEPEDQDLRQIGIAWLAVRQPHRRWRYVFYCLWTDQPEDELVDLGWKQLLVDPTTRNLREPWGRVFQRPPSDPEVWQEVEEWLLHNPDEGSWPKLWSVLLRADPSEDLIAAGESWLANHPNTHGKTRVRKELAHLKTL